jgi:murein L,D-transpeptidase YcbB/YkuD
LTEIQKQTVKQTARELCQAVRISLEMAIWAMKNAGYTRKETAEWLKLKDTQKIPIKEQL